MAGVIGSEFLTIDRRKLQDIAGRGSGQLVREVTVRAAAIAASTAPGKMGSTVRPILSGTKNNPFGIIMVDHPAAMYVINGTVPHDIPKGNGSKILKFTYKGKLMFRRHVHHPGTKANNFLWKAVLEAKEF